VLNLRIRVVAFLDGVGECLVGKDALAEEGVVDLGLLLVFVELHLDLSVLCQRGHAAHHTEQLHVQAYGLPTSHKALREVITPHVHVQEVVVVAAPHDNLKRHYLVIFLVDFGVEVLFGVEADLFQSVCTHEGLGWVLLTACEA
jgi:hypothetical protein